MANARFLDPSSIPLKRQSGGNIWATLVPVIQGAIVVGLLAVVGLFFVPVIQKEDGYKAELAKLQRQMAAAEDPIDYLGRFMPAQDQTMVRPIYTVPIAAQA